MFKNLSDIGKLDAKVFIFVFASCSMGPIWEFIKEQTTGDQNLMVSLSVLTVAIFTMEKRGEKGAGFLMTLLLVIVGLAGDFVGIMASSALTLFEVSWLRGIIIEMIFILIFVHLLSKILKTGQKYVEIDSKSVVFPDDC